jgi:hypothetical protein
MCPQSRQRSGRSLVGAVCVALVLAACLATSNEARAASVFVSTLTGANERPDPVTSGGAGSATAMLTGAAGGYVLSYSLNYTGLGSDAIAGHIHYSILPPGGSPTEQTGPVVHPLDADFGALGTEGSIDGQWRYDDSELPLTDALVDSLLDGELYFNVHSANYTGGEIRGQVDLVGTGNGGQGGTAIPLPPPLLIGLLGMATAGWAAYRRKRRGR